MILSAKPSASSTSRRRASTSAGADRCAIPAGQARHDGTQHGGVGLEGACRTGSSAERRRRPQRPGSPRAAFARARQLEEPPAPPAPSPSPRGSARLPPGPGRSPASRRRRPTHRAAARPGSSWERAPYRAGDGAAPSPAPGCGPPSPSAPAAPRSSRRSAGPPGPPGPGTSPARVTPSSQAERPAARKPAPRFLGVHSMTPQSDQLARRRISSDPCDLAALCNEFLRHFDAACRVEEPRFRNRTFREKMICNARKIMSR